jgi:hypothetical protein
MERFDNLKRKAEPLEKRKINYQLNLQKREKVGQLSNCATLGINR